MSLNGLRIDLRQLNKHVLECPRMPRFDSIYSNRNESTVNHIALCNNQYVLNTCIHVYENEAMGCMPVPFEIRFTRKISLTEPPRQRAVSLNESFYETQMKSYRQQFFLLDRMILLAKLYKFENYDYMLDNEEESLGSGMISCHEVRSQFEKRMCRLVESFSAYLKNLNHASVDTALPSSQEVRVRLDNEHEGKTLLHLSCACNMKQLFGSLIDLKRSIYNPSDLIGNELNLLKLDQDGFTPLVRFFDYYIFPLR